MRRSARVGSLLAGALVACFDPLAGQNVRTPPEVAAQANIAAQGYYAGQNSIYRTDITGVAADFRIFFPRAGLLSGSFQAYGREGNLRLGDNFLELQGLRWQGRHWTFRGGDFRVDASLVPFPFNNVYYPELAARGFRAEVSSGNRQFGVFLGQETILDGPRVPFRVTLPQRMAGVYLKQRIGSRVQVAARWLRLSETSDGPARPHVYSLPTRRFGLLDTATLQSHFDVTARLRLYSEASSSYRSRETTARASVSWLSGAVWESPRFLARANYVAQTAAYLPVYGYFLGDRRGPFGEFRFRPWKRIEVSGAVSRYENNLERHPEAPTARSTSLTGGAGFALPFRFSLTSQVSSLRYFTDQPSGLGRFDSNNRQLSASLSRPIRRHTPRVSVRALDLITRVRAEKQRVVEAEDIFQFRRFVFGAAARLQSMRAEERRHTVFVRGLAQLHLGRFSAHANIESGNDLVNRTVFATNAFSTTVVGMSANLGSGWSIQAEAFRNRLAMELNPETIFLYQTRGIPFSGALGGFNQWSLYVRVTRQIHWGVTLSTTGIQRYAAEHIPLVGVVEGVVYEQGLEGQRPAGAGVLVTLDGVRRASTDEDGKFQFSDVSEGTHKVALALAELPAAYDPGPNAEVSVQVRSRRVVRADLNVIRLGLLQGFVKGPAGSNVEGILVRLAPGDRYTTTDGLGSFGFYNLREGRYRVLIDQMSLPANAALTTPSSLEVLVDATSTPEPALFEFTIRPTEKPIRKVLEVDLTQPKLPQ